MTYQLPFGGFIRGWYSDRVSATNWWLRGASQSNTTNFCNVNNNGNANTNGNNATNANGVVPRFSNLK